MNFIESFYKGIDSRMRLQCNSCKKFYHDNDNKEFIHEYGECLLCDKVRIDVIETECYTELGTQYVNIIKS